MGCWMTACSATQLENILSGYSLYGAIAGELEAPLCLGNPKLLDLLGRGLLFPLSWTGGAPLVAPRSLRRQPQCLLLYLGEKNAPDGSPCASK